MKKVGIALIVIEILVIVSGFVTGKSVITKFFTSDEPGAALIAELLGFLSPGIIGIILFNKGKKKESAEGSAPAAEKTASGTAGTYTVNVCPKCGTKAEAGDAFCVNCGTKLMR